MPDVLHRGRRTGKTLKTDVAGIHMLPGVLKYSSHGADATIMGYTGNASVRHIPSEIEGFPAIDIHDGSFKGCSSLTSITIPDSVICIGDSAFDGCSSLTGIAIPDGVLSIWKFTFENCENRASIKLPGSVTSIGFFAFNGCNEVTVNSEENSAAYQYCLEKGILLPADLTNTIHPLLRRGIL